MALDPAYWTWLNAEWNAGRLTRPGAALQLLRANPRAFLRKYPLQNNFDPAMSQPTQAHIFNGAAGQRPGSVLRTRNMHTTESFTIQAAPGQLGEGHPFRVMGTYTAPSSVAVIPWVLLDQHCPDIMLTAKLTGCTFVTRAAGAAGNVEVAHLQPHQETGLQLNQRMEVPGQQAYGRFKYDITDRSVNIIGVRVGSRWKIYTQKLEKQALA